MKATVKRALLSGTTLRLSAVLMLGSVVLSEIMTPWRTAEVLAPKTRRQALSADTYTFSRSPTSVTTILAAPLFSSSRRPWAPPPPPVPPQPQLAPPVPAWPGYTLVGIVLSARGRAALIRLSDGQRTLRLHEGDRSNGWMLEQIGRESVRFTALGTVHNVSFLPPVQPSPDVAFASARGFPIR